jgi:hypothetical protein
MLAMNRSDFMAEKRQKIFLTISHLLKSQACGSVTRTASKNIGTATKPVQRQAHSIKGLLPDFADGSAQILPISITELVHFLLIDLLELEKGELLS